MAAAADSELRPPERRRERVRLRRGFSSEPEESPASEPEPASDPLEVGALEVGALERLRDLDLPRDPDAVLGVDSGWELESCTPEPNESPPMLGVESEL